MSIDVHRTLEFLETERIGALSIVLDDGTPHVAVMHFSSSREPMRLFFSTDRKSKKCSGLREGRPIQASCAVGFDESKMVTFQTDGYVRLISDRVQMESIQVIHYAKFPEAEKYRDDPDTVFLEFSPSWWRFTDYLAQPEVVIENDVV